MSKKLDYKVAWKDAIALLDVHREAVVAIAGFFLFAVSWIFTFLMPVLDVEGAETIGQTLELLQNYFVTNWMYFLPVMTIGSYGGLVIYVLLSAQNLSKVGDALVIALSRFLPYFIASLLVGWITILGFAAFLVPGLYLTARFAPLPAVMAADPKLGIVDGIKQSWIITDKIGWRTFFLLFIVWMVSWLLTDLANALIGLICTSIIGQEGIPLVQTFFVALFATAQTVLIIALITAIYRQLKPQLAI
jgi:hypothetical protein